MCLYGCLYLFIMIPYCGSLGLPQRHARQQSYQRSMGQQEIFSEASGEIGSAETRYTNAAALMGTSSYTSGSAATGAKRLMGTPRASLLRKRFFKCFRPADEAAIRTKTASTTPSRLHSAAEPAVLHRAPAGRTSQFRHRDHLAGLDVPLPLPEPYPSSKPDHSSYANPTPPTSHLNEKEETDEEDDFSFRFNPIDRSPAHDSEQASIWIQQKNSERAQLLQEQLAHLPNSEWAGHDRQPYC